MTASSDQNKIDIELMSDDSVKFEFYLAEYIGKQLPYSNEVSIGGSQLSHAYEKAHGKTHSVEDYFDNIHSYLKRLESNEILTIDRFDDNWETWICSVNRQAFLKHREHLVFETSKRELDVYTEIKEAVRLTNEGLELSVSKDKVKLVSIQHGTDIYNLLDVLLSNWKKNMEDIGSGLEACLSHSRISLEMNQQEKGKRFVKNTVTNLRKKLNAAGLSSTIQVSYSKEIDGWCLLVKSTMVSKE